MSEAVEYRVKSNKVDLCAVASLVINAIGMVQLTLIFAVHPYYQIVPLGMGVFFILGSLYLMAYGKAMNDDGRCRDFFEWKNGEEFSDPPLGEWAESLEERDAFEVNYGK